MESIKVSQVVELFYSEQVNEYLKIGWEILAVSPGRNEDGGAYHRYSLGWPSEKGDVLLPPEYRMD